MKQRLIWLIIRNTTIDLSLFEYLKLHCFAYLRHSIDERMHITTVVLDILYRNVLEIFSVTTKLGFPIPHFPTTIPLRSVTSDVGTRSVCLGQRDATESGSVPVGKMSGVQESAAAEVHPLWQQHAPM